MKKDKKMFITIGIIIAIVLVVVYCVIKSSVHKEVKSYNIESINNLMINGYDNVREMDFIDITTLFGIDISDRENSVFVTNVEDLSNGINKDTMLVVVMNTNNTKEYYDIFQSFIDSYKFNTFDKETLDYYDKVIIKKGDGFVYFLMGSDPIMIEKEINSFYY